MEDVNRSFGAIIEEKNIENDLLEENMDSIENKKEFRRLKKI